MRVLFVSSGNSNAGIIPFIKSQGESLIEEGVDLEYFTIKGKGVKGYLKNIPLLRNYINHNKFDLIHAHYSLTAFVVSLACIGKKEPIIVSLMGSDTESSSIERYLIKIFNLFFWSKIIVKSESMAKKMHISNVYIIPNGINQSVFMPIDMNVAKAKLGLKKEIQYVLFAANPQRHVKNYPLAENAYKLLNNKNTELKVVFGVEHKEMALYLNAASVVLLTSRYEGSPNIIKEAMACNRPIVSTDVGDVKWITSKTDGVFISKNTKKDISRSINKALSFSSNNKHTNGVDRINMLKLGSKSVAMQLINLYSEMV